MENFCNFALHQLYCQDWFLELRNRRAELLCDLLQPKIQDGSTMLEIGSGKGDLLNMLALNYPKQIFGLDIKNQRINPDRSNAPFLIADGASLPFPDGTFDVGLLAFVLHHIPKNLISQVLTEALRVSKRVLIIEDYIGRDASDFLAKPLGIYVKTIDRILNVGVPGGALGNQQTVVAWEQIFNQCGAQVNCTKIFTSRALGKIPLSHSLTEIELSQN